jgi:3-oxoadipate enol-lactonase
MMNRGDLMGTFKSNGMMLTYDEYGSGEPLVLLHGLTGNRHMFDAEIKVFKKYFRTIVLDARGHGESDKPTSYTLDDHVGDVLRLLEHLEIEETYLLGVSMGSYIAQGVAIASPERVKKLILVATKSQGKTSSMEALFTKHAEELEGMDFSEKVVKVSPYIFHDLKAVGKWSHDAAKKGSPMTSKEIEAANDALMALIFKKIYTVSQQKHEQWRLRWLEPTRSRRETAKLIPDATFVEFIELTAPNVEQTALLDFV